MRSVSNFFNIWAIFIESKDSGMSINEPKDTAFKLYTGNIAFNFYLKLFLINSITF